MILMAGDAAEPLEDAVLRSMFEARKAVFVDLLKWDVPVVAGRFELDQFDDEHAVYLIVTDGNRTHLGSARLLKTSRPHILDTLFPELCASAPPRGPQILEITRFCLARNQNAQMRAMTRDRLVSALADYALAHGVTAYTGVAELGWLQQILAFGWRCRPLGLPRAVDGRTLGALKIDIDDETRGLLARNGIYRFEPIAPLALLKAA